MDPLPNALDVPMRFSASQWGAVLLLASQNTDTTEQGGDCTVMKCP